MATWIESEGHAPDSAIGIEAQFLHVGVPRSFQRAHAGATRRGAEVFDDPGLRQQFVLHGRRQRIELRLELVDQRHNPCHGEIMVCEPYAVKSIFCRWQSRVEFSL